MPVLQQGRKHPCPKGHPRNRCSSAASRAGSDRAQAARGDWNSVNTYNKNPSYNNHSSDNTNRWGEGGKWNSGNRAVLYSEYNLSGETFVVNPGGARNLECVGLNDSARSLRIEAGYWLFCSDADFQGNCHTYGPGDYPNLPSGQSHSISSGRQVSNNFPYRNNPNWNGS